jgi:hypothetical protein
VPSSGRGSFAKDSVSQEDKSRSWEIFSANVSEVVESVDFDDFDGFV